MTRPQTQRSPEGYVVFLVFVRESGQVGTSELLKTGVVAERLGVSRQHVVDLCNRGDLAFVYVGKHRRVPTSEVERLLGGSMTREQERSLWLHRALVTSLLLDPDGSLQVARDNLDRWIAAQRPDGMSSRYLSRWREVLDGGLDQVIDTVLSASPESIELRQNSPFAGVLPDDVRVRVLQAFNRHWKRDHEEVA